jgi:DHA1 family inner membrane transport protein
MAYELNGEIAESQPAPSIGLAHAVLALGGFVIGTTEFATMSFLPGFTAELHVDAPAGGHVVSAYALGVVVGAPLLAILGARLERRLLLMLLLAWFGVGNVLSAMAPNLQSLIAMRFLTGLPHGVYFGTAVLLAVNLVVEARRPQAVGRILMGLALATMIGVPLASLLSHWLGWRAGFAAVGLLAGATVLLLGLVPKQLPVAGASMLRELGAFRRVQVWLSVAIGAVGFGGLFAVYTYLASSLEGVSWATENTVAAMLAVFGAGIAYGNVVAPRLARRGVMFAAGVLLAWSALALAVYPLSIASPWTLGLAVFSIGCGAGLGAVLQMRLMDVAGDAQNLAASLNHVAFNIANALGPWLGGMAIAAGFGWASAGWVGVALALGGLSVWGVALAFEQQEGITDSQ